MIVKQRIVFYIVRIQSFLFDFEKILMKQLFLKLYKLFEKIFKKGVDTLEEACYYPFRC
jgi:hypothetical protein